MSSNRAHMRPIEPARYLLIAVWITTLLISPRLFPATPPKANADSYPAHAATEAVAIGADFAVHTFVAESRTYVADKFLVVQVGCYPRGTDVIAISASQFRLRIDGKRLVYSQPPEFVAAALKYPDWELRPQVTAAAGIGGTGVMIGGRQDVERFPGDPRPSQRRLPAPPRVPEGDEQSGVPQNDPLPPDEAVRAAALMDTRTAKALAGYVFFPWTGNMKKVKRIDLLYSGPGGDTIIPLR
jgi:hypothetical protein